MKCKEGAVLLIDQIVQAMRIIPEESYSKPQSIFNDSTFGRHFRHIYDFFHCLCIQCDQKTVDYAARLRDEKIENDCDYAIERFEHVKYLLQSFDENTAVKVYTDFDESIDDRTAVNSSIGRELMYAYDHAVHHLAIIKIGLKTLDPALEIDERLGVAASTIQHQYEISHGH